MSKEYTGDTAIRPLEKLMNDFCRSKGYDSTQVFTSFLDYLIWMFNPYGEKLADWNYTRQETEKFYEMATTYFKIQNEQIEQKGWYDAFGDLFMALHPSGNGKGQFFTPPSVCQATAMCTLIGAYLEEKGKSPTPFGRRITINDPAAGSSRLLLSANAIIQDQMRKDLKYSDAEIAARRPYLVAEDLDLNCVKMSAINIMIHGCFGEAVCHNTLTEPDAVRAGYIINESMWPMPCPVPSIRAESDPRRFVSTFIWASKKNATNKEPEPEPPKPEPPKPDKPKAVEPVRIERKRPEYKQLELW